MNVNYEYYRLFYYVCKYHSITRAANVLRMSQPNVTRALNRLEEQLGCKLLVRSTRGVTMTPEVIEIRSAGIWLTRPSPIVRMPKRLTHQATSLSNMSMPMRMPPTMLIAVMMSPATASPFTNFIAPSIAP